MELVGSFMEAGLATKSTEIAGEEVTHEEPSQAVPEIQLENTLEESSSTVLFMRRKVAALNGTEKACIPPCPLPTEPPPSRTTVVRPVGLVTLQEKVILQSFSPSAMKHEGLKASITPLMVLDDAQTEPFQAVPETQLEVTVLESSSTE